MNISGSELSKIIRSPKGQMAIAMGDVATVNRMATDIRQEREMEDLAQRLNNLQLRKNAGRGVECVKTLIQCLRQHDLVRAKALASNEADKIRAYPDIEREVKKLDFI
jgi:hypothetical protein